MASRAHAVDAVASIASVHSSPRSRLRCRFLSRYTRARSDLDNDGAWRGCALCRLVPFDGLFERKPKASIAVSTC